jgi:aromatic-L-amino-acid decarboxylase
MDHEDLRRWSKRTADWAADYHAGLRDRPVRAPLTPGATRALLPPTPPEAPEDPEAIWADFLRIVPDAMTHWQHPRFFAYFPANAAPASMWAEQAANAIAAQCMLWQTSPAGTEIEQVMVDWLRQALGLPDRFSGTLHDSATTATLSAVLTMRERALGFEGLTRGLSGAPPLRLYASAETHSSVDKAARLSGIGQENLVKLPSGPDGSMDPADLAAAIAADRAAGYLPAGAILCAGGTSTGAFDRIGACIAVARAAGLPTHVDAAWAGSAMICPEFRPLWAGVEGADSVVFNPHKWLGAQFDCAVQFLADPAPQVRTLGLRPDYLRTPGEDEIVNFNEWTVPLGRRFRALKLWFVMRAEGLEGLRTRIRDHVAWAEEAAAAIAALPGVEIVTPPRLALFSFALAGGDGPTAALLDRLNDEGRVYLTQTRVGGRLAIRVSVGGWTTTRADMRALIDAVREALL